MSNDLDSGSAKQVGGAVLSPETKRLMTEGRWAEAAERLTQEAKAGTPSHALLAALGKALLKAGHPDEALPHLAQALALDPRDDKTLRRIKSIADRRHPPAAAAPAPSESRSRESIAGVMKLAKDFGFKPGTIFDIGVCYGTPGLYDDFPDALYMLVDPVEESRPIMEHICSGLRHAEYRVAAAGAEPGTGTLLIPGFPSGSQMVDPVGTKKKGEQRQVPVITIDQLADEVGASGPHVIKVDTEGSELQVLRGASRILKDTEMIIMESRLRPVSASPQIHEIVCFLYDRGFVVYDIITPNYHGTDRTLLQVDLVAVKEDGFFRSRDAYRAPPFVSANAVSSKLNAIKKRRKFERALAEATTRS